jgi:C4-dicarboxylate transporter DctM subunit
LFSAAYAFVGHMRGGLAMATIVACAGFGAICGSSIATAATMAKVAYPSMRELGYSDRLSTGAIAAGGTLGILIPPSTLMVIYGVMTETNIGKMFAAGILPGILATFLLCLAVQWTVWREPASGPRGEKSTWRARMRAIEGVWAVALLFIIVMGGIYGGVFTATEGAGIGAFGALCIAIARRALSWRTFLDALIESGRTTAMLFVILTGALMFAEFVNYTTMPHDLKTLVSTLNLSPIMVIAAICAIYVILGTAMEELSMILLTVPVFFPLVVHLGFDPIWFGILVVVVVEIGLISPPVGMNLFVINALLPHVPTPTLFRGVTPFVVADVVRLAILIAFPIISLWLPSVLRIAGKGY